MMELDRPFPGLASLHEVLKLRIGGPEEALIGPDKGLKRQFH